MMGYGWGMGAGGWLVMVLFWALLIGVVVWAVVRVFPQQPPGRSERRETALEVLDRRLASGEIDVDEYVRRRAELLDRPRDVADGGDRR